VPNGCVGILIDEANSKRWAETIERLIDPVLRQRMDIEGRRWVLEQFSVEKGGVELRKMFDAVTQV
jgi:glycosyltransferase involved in cell wall biosynthesis